LAAGLSRPSSYQQEQDSKESLCSYIHPSRSQPLGFTSAPYGARSQSDHRTAAATNTPSLHPRAFGGRRWGVYRAFVRSCVRVCVCVNATYTPTIAFSAALPPCACGLTVHRSWPPLRFGLPRSRRRPRLYCLPPVHPYCEQASERAQSEPLTLLPAACQQAQRCDASESRSTAPHLLLHLHTYLAPSSPRYTAAAFVASPTDRTSCVVGVAVCCSLLRVAAAPRSYQLLLLLLLSPSHMTLPSPYHGTRS
jgi:hypothetical protein